MECKWSSVNTPLWTCCYNQMIVILFCHKNDTSSGCYLSCLRAVSEGRNSYAFPWRHNENNGVSNRQPHDCLLNCLNLAFSLWVTLNFGVMFQIGKRSIHIRKLRVQRFINICNEKMGYQELERSDCHGQQKLNQSINLLSHKMSFQTHEGLRATRFTVHGCSETSKVPNICYDIFLSIFNLGKLLTMDSYLNFDVVNSSKLGDTFVHKWTG